MSPGELSRFWFRQAIGEIAGDPGHFARHLARKAQLLVNHAEVPDNLSYAFFRENVSRILKLPLPTWGAVLPLALWGLFAARRQRRATPLLLYLAAYATSLLLFYNTSRYRLPAAPAVIVFAAAGLWHIADAVRERQRGLCLAAGLWLALAWPVVYSRAYDEDLARHRVNVGRRHQDRAAFQESLARMYARAGDDEAAGEARDRARALNGQAERELRLALSESPRSPQAREALTAQLVGRTRELLRTRRYQEARSGAEDLTATFPTLPDGWILLGRAYEGLDRFDRAVHAQRRALDLAPDDPRPREALERLRSRRP
jgi:tetratricopeptide (TPR) repeat protein